MTEPPTGAGDGTLLGTQDLHVHTTMSDGDLELHEVVALAAELGVQVGIADHVSARTPSAMVHDCESLDNYLRAITGADVLRSAELCWSDPFSTSAARDLEKRVDYLIGSNHGFALPDGTFASPWLTTLPPAWADRPQDVVEVMVDNLCELVRTMPIQIVAHSTLLPTAVLQLEADVHAWWTDEREDRFIEAALEAGVAIEISNRYRLPHDRLLRKGREAGATFSLGSDGHHRDQVARLEWAIASAHRAGIGDGQIFRPQR